MAKKKNSNLSYDQYVSKYGDKKAGTISYDQYMAKQAEREQQAQQQAREQRQNYINKLAAKATIQKARDMNNPIMNNTGMGQAENARNSFGIGTDKADKRGYVEWLRKLDKTKKDKEAGVQPQQKVTPIVQRSPEEIKTEFMTQKYNQLQEALADRTLGFEAVEDNRKKNNTGNNWTLGQQFEIDRERQQYQKEGRYGDSGLPWYMNDEQRQAMREESVRTAQEKRDLAKQYEEFDQDAALGGIFDVMYNRDTANERAILNNPAYAGTDFERNAQATLGSLEFQYPTYRRYSIDNARKLLEEGIDLNAETPVEKEKLREQVYDRVMQDNMFNEGLLDTYKERIKGMSYEEKKALDDELDKAIAGMASPWGTDKTQTEAIESLNREAEAYDAQVKAVDAAQNYYDFIQRKREFAADDYLSEFSSTYDPSLHPEAKMEYDAAIGDYVMKPQGSEIDKAYWYANNWQNMGGMEEKLKFAGKLEYANKYMFLAADPEILEMFNKFYAKDKESQLDRLHGLTGSNLAQQFLDGLDPYLTSMLVEYQNNLIQSTAQDGVQGTALRVISPALQAVGGVSGTIAAITGQDLSSGLYLPSRVVAQTRSRQNEDIGKLADQAFGEFGGNATRFMLGVVDSVADNVFAMGVGTGLGGEGTKKAMRLVQMIMSGSATSNKMVEMLENGTQPTEAALYAVGDGVIEWITERYSLERIMGPDVKQMFGNKKAIASFIARSAGAEGSEEINSGLLNMGLDYVLSMVYGHENELKQKYNELVAGGMSDEEASRKVLEDKLAELGTEGLAGAISGGMMAESRVISTAIENRGTGKKIKGKKSGTDVMMDLARGMAEGTDSRTLADQLAAEIEKGNEVSNYDLGRLANLTALEVGEQRSQVIKDTITNNVVQQLKDKGVSEEQAQQFAAIISNNIFTGAKLTRAEISTLGQDERAIQLWKDFNTMSAASMNLAKAVSTETKPLDSIANKMGELVSDTVKASSAAAAEVEKSIQETESMEEAIDNLQARRSGLLSEQYANLAKEYLQNNPEAKKNKAYLDDVMKIRLAAMTMDTMPETSLEAEQAQKLYDAAKQEFNEIDEERIKNQRPAMEGQGVTTYNGAEYGTEAWKAATEGLSKTTKNVMGAVGEIAARFGYRVNMVNDPDNPDVYGFEDADTGAITINVANGLKHHMLVTMAHEMTHWLEQNSRQGYDDLRSFVLQSLREQGENIQDRIVKIMDNYNMVMGEKVGAGMTINGAMLELVAQSSEGLLSSKRAAQELQNVNPDLFSKVKSFVRNVVARINAAIKGMDYEGSLSKEARALEKYKEQLADIWFNGRKSAMPGEPTEAQAQAEETAAEGTSFSLREMDDGTKYVYLDTDQEIFNNADIKEYPRIIEKYITNKFKGQIVGTENRAYVDRRTAKEYAHPANKNIAEELYAAKGRSAPELDNLMDAAVFYLHQADDGRHPEAVNGWDRYKTIIYVPNTQRYYEGMISIEKVAKGDRFHDFTQLKDVTDAMQGRNASRATGNIPNENIPDIQENNNAQSGTRSYSVAKRGEDPELDRLYDELSAAREEENAARAAYQERKEEYNERVSTYMDNKGDDKALNELNDWAKENYLPLKERLDAAHEKVQAINKQWSEYIENRDVAEEKAAIEKSGLTEQEYRRKQAMKEFGSTSDFREAGYLLPNGSMLNFTGEKGKHYGMRGEDHRAIGRIYASSEISNTKAMITFMNDGNIRIMAETPGIDIVKEPTADQYAQIRAMARRFAGKEYFNVDFSNEYGDVVDSIEYDGRVNAERIANDIKHYFRTGEVPQQSVVSQFHYSVAQIADTDSEGKQLTKEQKEFFKNSKAVDSKGRLIKLYHGTNRGGFTQFIDTHNIGYFFTNKIDIAETYSDAFDEYAPKKAKSWEEINELAHELGYSIEKTEDGNYRWFENGELLDWGFYKPEQIKQAMNDLNDEYIEQNGKKQNYAVYLNLTNPLIIEGNGSNWDAVIDHTGGNMHPWSEIPDELRQEMADLLGYSMAELAGMGYNYEEELPVYDLDNMEVRNWQNTRDWVTEAQEMGYDGVIFRDIQDEGQYGNGWRTSDVYVAMNPEQIKSVNNTEPTNDQDIRYSIAQGPDMDVDTFMLGLNEFNLPTYQEKTMLRQYKSHKGTIKILEEKIRTWEKERDEIMARGRLDPATQAKVDELNKAVSDAKAATKKKQKALIDQNNHLITEKWAIQKEGRRLTNDEKARLKEINQRISANNDEINGSSYDLSQLIRNTEEQKKALRGDVKMNFADSTKLSQINRRLEADRQKLNRMENELVRITGEKGYARLMKDQRTLMENLVSGRTAEDLEDTVTAMQENLDTVTKEMAERAENLKKLASAEAVLKIRQMFDNRGLKRIAAKLKADVGSELENTEIENRLALIALKMKEGKYDAENAEELADMLAGRIKREMTGYYIPALRGSTIVLGDVQMKELKGTHRTLADIRAQLAGTGIRISDKGNTTLDSKWEEEICKLFPELDPKERVGNQLDALLDKIMDEKEQQETVYNNEDLMKINTKLLEAAQELIPEIITDENSLRLIRESMAFVTRVSGAAKNNAAALEEINNMISRLQKKGEKAVKTAKKLTGDISETIDYFDQLSLQSEAAMWKEERLALIDQLKSENTKNLMEEAARWRERIEKDKNYREIAAENLQTRKRITTNVSRVRKLLINETDLKNIPEHMKGLAREMLTRIVDNDLGMRKITGIDKKDLAETKRVLTEMRKLDGDFMPDDLKMMADEEAQAAVFDAMADLEEGLQEYNSRRTGDMMKKAEAVKATLDKISDAVSTITSIINAERNVSYLDRVVPIGYAAGKIRADMANSRHKGEWKGTGSKAVEAVKRSVVYGNETPEYFIDGLHNRGMNELWDDARQAENRNGLEAQKAQDRLAQLAQETNFKAWANEKHEVTLGGKKRTITIGNMMELYAVWKREKTSNPEMSEHLNKGGVFFEEQETGGKLRREVVEQRAIRITDGEIIAMYNNMTEDQKKLIEGIVRYLSDDMSRLGNEASMRMYGIRKYKELYYFPMKVWDGVKSARSDKGITGTNENRMAHYSFSKRRQNMARNALVIGDFMTDAVNHIVEMINYNTMAPAIENINKVLNYKFTEEAGTDNETQRNMRVLFQQAYGKDALNYLETLLKDMNGGVTQDQRKTLRDRALTMFKKNAVAGSLSVALQQPLSYIRASMMISPKYLAPAPVTSNWKNSYKEMMQYSGIAVIKKMGRFDMNFGQSAKDYIMPETKQSLYNRTSDALTKAPELMDAMTWTWIWSATKAETAAKNPGMDTTSAAFLNLTAKRFNEVMRKTQVYDSVLVKSSNMRSNNLGMKVLTSFMAEPTLTLNMLADAVRNVGAEGGKKKLAKALSTFFISAIFQAGVKGLMGSGRTPDKKKTWLENFLNKFQYNLISEGNMLSLIPGYSDLIEVLKTGELQDDAMGAIGKLSSIVDTLRKAAQGNGKSAWRDVEDTVGQFTQLFTNIPMKNLMRDARAIYNWIAGSEYADRPTSSAVIRYQTEANFFNADNMLGTINTWLGEAGFVSTNRRYYSRIYDAMKKGDKGTEKGIKEYLSLAKGVKDDTINTGIKTAAKSDTSMTEAQKDAWMIKNNLMGENNVSTITTQYKEGKISAAEARKLWKELDPKLTDNDLYWKQDRADYQKETGTDKVSGYSYRLHDAIAENKGESIRKAIKDMLDHGVKKESIKTAITEKWKEIYLNADSRTRTAIRDAIQKAYKAIGLTAQDANKVIDNWKKKK